MGRLPGIRRPTLRHRGESARRSFAETVSWRIVGSLHTLVSSFLILSLLGPVLGTDAASHAENARTAGAIALTEIVTKIGPYCVHEQAWHAFTGERSADRARRRPC